MKVMVYYTDNSNVEYDCNHINYYNKTAFLETKDGERLCIPFNNVYAIREKAEEDSDINVGDEVSWYNEKIVITRLYNNGGFDWCDGINKDGMVFNVLKEKVTKTGRRFNIESLLEEMRNE